MYTMRSYDSEFYFCEIEYKNCQTEKRDLKPFGLHYPVSTRKTDSKTQ